MADSAVAPAPRASSRLAGRAGSALSRVVALVSTIVRACGRVQIFSQASSLAFLSLTAIVPVTTVILTVMASVPAFADMREQLQAFLAANFLLPQVADQVMGYINDFAAAAGRLSVVGTLAFVATAFTTMLTVDHALNEIWGSPEARPIVYRLLIYWAALTVGPIVLAAVIAMRLEDVVSNFGGSMLGAPTWLPWLLMTLLLTLIYHVVPNRRVRIAHALLGGAIASLLLEALKAGLQYYITAYPTYQAVYGAFSVLPVFLLWLYCAWFAVLLGAVVAAHSGYPELLGEQTVSPRQEFERGRRVLEAVSAAAARGRGVPAQVLAQALDRNAATARRVVQALVRMGYLVRVAPGAVATPIRAGAVGAAAAKAAVADGDARDGEQGSDLEREAGTLPAREIWAETWMATPQLPSMTLRPLYDEVWVRGRLDDLSTFERRPSWWRRHFGRPGPNPTPQPQRLPSDIEIDEPLGVLLSPAARRAAPEPAWRRWS